MRKFKPHKGLKKRVRLTARGKLMRRLAGAGHLMSKKSGSRCRRLRRAAPLVGNVSANIQRALGEK